ncbi:phage holin family protein [Ensifer sp. PDNC004]|uniref:phage holin family protein n=1 Tax=Ensifer sp. PDNC004 TaxID=2811423 RepID=UPI0019655EB8|nr:phage holin family protein [Ensifer sp. PDNC004]QRY68211.1 phage holin family protein [Ensifer sp. PDNC004]
MPEKYTSLIELLNATLGGAATTVIAVLAGRLMWHTNEVRKMRRKFFGKELLWEMPIAVGMAFIGEGLANWLALGQPMATGMIAALAYLGPRGSEVLFMRWFGQRLSERGK